MNYCRNPTDLVKAGKRSLAWFDKESTKTHFPIEGISHAHAKASVERLLHCPVPHEPVRHSFHAPARF